MTTCIVRPLWLRKKYCTVRFGGRSKRDGLRATNGRFRVWQPGHLRRLTEVAGGSRGLYGCVARDRRPPKTQLYIIRVSARRGSTACLEACQAWSSPPPHSNTPTHTRGHTAPPGG